MFKLEECTVQSICEAFESGELTSAKLVMQYMQRIALYDKGGPKINSVLELNPEALFIAEAMDRERLKGKVRSALHGIPILLKDNINTSDMMLTSAGSIALDDNYATYDAFVAKKCREAGLVIMGKANMTELANFMDYNMKSGYSSRGGQVMNPYKPGQEVWGSSTGSAVAVSANFCALSVGTETNGSILAPSYINGTVGIKPTRGLISRHGIIPVSIAQDTAGPMARTVADAAALLNVLAGEDKNDPSTWSIEDKIPKDYTDSLKVDGLKGLMVGINRGYYDVKEFYTVLDDEMKEITENAVKLFEECGAVLVQDTNVCHLKKDLNVLLYEFKKCLNAYLSTTSPGVKNRSLKDLIDFYGDHPNEGLKYGMSVLQDAQYKTSGTLTEPAYINDRLECLRLSRDEGLEKIMDEHNLDILFCPAMTDLAPVSGYPGINLPAGYLKDGTPFGITLIGRPFCEPLLIQAAYAFEQASKVRKAPILKSVETQEEVIVGFAAAQEK